MPNDQFFDLREEFVTLAYAYGVEPAVAELLGESVHEKLTKAWQLGLHQPGALLF